MVFFFPEKSEKANKNIFKKRKIALADADMNEMSKRN